LNLRLRFRKAAQQSLNSGTNRIDRHARTTSAKVDYQYHIHPDDPTSACVDLRATETYGREGQLDARIEAHQAMTCDRTHFFVEEKLYVLFGFKRPGIMVGSPRRVFV
jgi:hypothetical protein